MTAAPSPGEVACVVLGAVTWLRTDPLLPVAFVEDVVARAFALSFAIGVLCVLALACVVAAPLIAARSGRRDARVVAVGAASSAGFAGAIAASVLGAFAGVGVLLAETREKVAATTDEYAQVHASRIRRRQP